MTSERRKELLKLGAIAVVIDLITSAAEIPFLLNPLTVVFEEILEQLIATLIGRTAITLNFTDRVIGMLPIPGITPVTVRVLKELLFK